MNDKNMKNKKITKLIIIILELLAISLVIYVVALPFYPNFKYKITLKNDKVSDSKNIEIVKERTVEYKNRFPDSEYSVSPNRVIVESNDANYGLSKGSWRVPNSSTPDKGGNTVITGHRFKYLPPNNLTFYHFDKLEEGDIFSIIWEKKYYYYRIKEVKIVSKTELSILEPTKEPIVTLFTCHPIYSTEKRLVIIGKLITE